MKELTDFQQRVIAEKSELDKKLKNLNSFIKNRKVFMTIDMDEQVRLIRQQIAMSMYSDILNERIVAFRVKK